ncbi:hypothetical protein BRAO375_3210010 [Bradyrhizobium sp. ORS 375]|nr:hypothetical protein BRAO375_3210010 [Bradyrhizobium sp. ORS 375]
MNEWMNMSALGTMVLQEGVKFLYEQALMALRRKLAPHANAPHAPPHLPPAFDSASAPLTYHVDKIEAVEEPLRKLSQMASKWASGAEPINPADPEFTRIVAGLRLAMEHVFQQQLTFKGETRAHDGVLGHPLALAELLSKILPLGRLAGNSGAASGSPLLNIKILSL